MVLGITGGIASGKSTISDYLRSKGIPIVDADAISRNITKKGGDGALAVERTFGSEFFCDGELDRKKLSGYCFGSDDLTKRLNDILHPLIIKETEARLKAYENEKITVLDAPLLIEAGLHKRCDRVIVVVCNEDIRIKRATERSSISADEVCSRIKHQLSDEERIKYADFVVDNSGALEQTLKQIDRIIDEAVGGE